ncbi:MAG: hypothetical protein ACXVQY_12045 [Actinomycetota bacterium]
MSWARVAAGKKEASMRLSWRDQLATVFVGAGVMFYLMWLADVPVSGLTTPRTLAWLVLGSGIAASAIAVVYGVGAGLLRAPKPYLTVASLLGVAALVGGLIVIVTGSETMLVVLVGATAALWMMSTIRHMTIAELQAEETIDEDVKRAA